MFGGLRMERDLYYIIEENGYHIFDRNSGLFHIHQYEPYIPDHSKSYEDNAKAQIHEFMVPEYVEAVMSDAMTIDAVPAEYKAEVQAIIDGQGNDLTSEDILSELESEVGING